MVVSLFLCGSGFGENVGDCSFIYRSSTSPILFRSNLIHVDIVMNILVVKISLCYEISYDDLLSKTLFLYCCFMWN